jgi:hypothetical protein
VRWLRAEIQLTDQVRELIGSLDAEPASESGRYEKSEYRSTDSGY